MFDLHEQLRLKSHAPCVSQMGLRKDAPHQISADYGHASRQLAMYTLSLVRPTEYTLTPVRLAEHTLTLVRLSEHTFTLVHLAEHILTPVRLTEYTLNFCASC